jgi:hypothetical protein
MENSVDENTISVETNVENSVETNVENSLETNESNKNICHSSIKYISEGVGWIGSILVLIPYVTPLHKTTDFILNTLGASGLFLVCLTSKQHQSVIINAAWIIGGFYKYYS